MHTDVHTKKILRNLVRAAYATELATVKKFLKSNKCVDKNKSTQYQDVRNQTCFIIQTNYSLVTVKIPESASLPIIFEALQVYVPTSNDVTLYTVNVFSVVVMFNDLDTIMYLLLLSDTFIITSLKYQLMPGTGSPTA